MELFYPSKKTIVAAPPGKGRGTFARAKFVGETVDSVRHAGMQPYCTETYGFSLFPELLGRTYVTIRCDTVKSKQFDWHSKLSDIVQGA